MLPALSYDDVGVASAWRPAEYVTLDPRIQAGAPGISGTPIPTATLAAMLESEPAEQIAQQYGITVDEVEAADKFEQRLIDGHGLARERRRVRNSTPADSFGVYAVPLCAVWS